MQSSLKLRLSSIGITTVSSFVARHHIYNEAKEPSPWSKLFPCCIFRDRTVPCTKRWNALRGDVSSFLDPMFQQTRDQAIMMISVSYIDCALNGYLDHHGILFTVSLPRIEKQRTKSRKVESNFPVPQFCSSLNSAIPYNRGIAKAQSAGPRDTQAEQSISVTHTS